MWNDRDYSYAGGYYIEMCIRDRPWPALCVQSAELNDKNMQLLLQQHGEQQKGSCSEDVYKRQPAPAAGRW